MSRQENTVVHTIEGRYLRETGKACQFRVIKISGEELEEEKTEWFPFSQVTKIIKQKPGSLEPDSLIVSEWILKQKELI